MNRLDWLENQLDQEGLHPALRMAYEEEADMLARAATEAQANRRKATLELQNKINNIKTLYEGGSRRELVKLYGHEFIDDYETRTEGDEFVVYSHVARDFQNTRWVCFSADMAEEKIVELLGHRVYDHYVRERF